MQCHDALVCVKQWCRWSDVREQGPQKASAAAATENAICTLWTAWSEPWSSPRRPRECEGFRLHAASSSCVGCPQLHKELERASQLNPVAEVLQPPLWAARDRRLRLSGGALGLQAGRDAQTTTWNQSLLGEALKSLGKCVPSRKVLT